MESLRRFTTTMRRRAERDEASNTFAILIVLLPILLGAFGLGFDFSRNLYIRTTLQNNLDMATVAGAGVTKINGSADVQVDKANAYPTVERVYAIGRAEGPVIGCIGDKATIPATGGLQRCWKKWTAATTNTATCNTAAKCVRYGVQERSRNLFLPLLGVPYQDYFISSVAKVKQQTN